MSALKQISRLRNYILLAPGHRQLLKTGYSSKLLGNACSAPLNSSCSLRFFPVFCNRNGFQSSFPALSSCVNTYSCSSKRGNDFSTNNINNAGKSDSKSSAAIAEADIYGDASKLGLFAKFKLMYKKYWYVLLPVHIVTSIGWLGGFYYMSKSGVDIAALLDYLHFSQAIIDKIQNSDKLGHFAIAYLCYKIATPARYALTLGGTTLSIKYLVQAGHIKPMPSKQEIIRMYEEKKATRAAARRAEKTENQNK